jgi:hypothetical protein
VTTDGDMKGDVMFVTVGFTAEGAIYLHLFVNTPASVIKWAAVSTIRRLAGPGVSRHRIPIFYQDWTDHWGCRPPSALTQACPPS